MKANALRVLLADATGLVGRRCLDSLRGEIRTHRIENAALLGFD